MAATCIRCVSAARVDCASVCLADSRQVDVAVVFHVKSGTKVGDIRNSLRPFLKNLFRYADINGDNVRVSLSYFRKNPTLLGNLRKFRTTADFTRAVDGIGRGVRGRRNDGGGALAEVRTTIFDTARGDRANVPNAVIFITDNKVNIGPNKLQAEATALKNAGVRVITVGVGSADRAELRSAASQPSVENSFYFNQYSALRNDATAAAVRNRIYARES